MRLFKPLLSLLAGPFDGRRRLWQVLVWCLACLFLTLVTQTGGLVLWISFGLSTLLAWRGWRLLALFTGLYLVTTLFLLPPLAERYGRERLTCFADTKGYGAVSPIFCLSNRNYATPAVKQMLEGMAKALPDATPRYLDAGFPLPGLPLLPHLSHGDGRKVDLALPDAGPGLPSPLGYWAFAQPRPGEAQPCAGRAGAMRWDVAWFQPLVGPVALDETRAKRLLNHMARQAGHYGIEKILLEPHLKTRLGLTSPLIRFQGCHAARHDDHIHVQVR